MSAAALFLETPLPLLLGGLLGKGEAVQLALHLQPTYQQWECCLRWWSNRGENCYERPACPNSLLLHLLVPLFGQPPCWLLGEHQILVKNGWTSLVFTPWAWASFPLVVLRFGGNGRLCIEVTLSAAIAASIPSFTFLCSHLRSRKGLTFLTISWIFLSFFWLWRAISRNCYDREWMG
jgi:hypothetical protein